MISRITRSTLPRSLNKLAFASFSGGHHAKPYDWRDDHALNPFYEQDPRTLGCQDGHTFSFPHEADHLIAETPFPDSYNPKDLTTNFVGHWPLLSVAETNLLETPSQEYWDDIAHEWDYESEDFDFQP